jgi:iron complex transport system ATP-binding protein
MLMTIDDLSFSYKNGKILDGVSFSVGEHECVSILGPNGAGKTTLLRCMNRILTPQRGEIFIKDRNIREYSRREIAHEIGYVPQRFEAGGLTIFDMVLLGRKPYISFATGEEDLKIVTGLLEKMDLQRLSLKYTHQVSGGELQKAVIARALVQEPGVLIMDEPVSSLDLKNSHEILTLLGDIIRDHHVSVVMSVHDINIALRYSHRLIFLKEGRVFASVTPCEVTPEIIEEVYHVKVNIHEFEDYHHIVPV